MLVYMPSLYTAALSQIPGKQHCCLAVAVVYRTHHWSGTPCQHHAMLLLAAAV